ncbi:hypothetical protein XENOCAPTIV_025432, partial [Xenoophorus captivus]
RILPLAAIFPLLHAYLIYSGNRCSSGREKELFCFKALCCMRGNPSVSHSASKG